MSDASGPRTTGKTQEPLAERSRSSERDHPGSLAVAPIIPAIRVAQVMGSFLGGGAQRLAWNLAGCLCEHAESFAVALKKDGLPESSGEFCAPPFECAVPRNPIGVVAAIARLRDWVRSHRVQILHVHGSGSLPFVVLATRGLETRCVFTWHDSSEVLAAKWQSRPLHQWALRRCDLLFGSSNDVAARLRQASGQSVEVWPNGVPIVEPRSQDSNRTPTIVWMGRFVPPKDPQAIVRAAAHLRSEGLKFRVTMLGGALPHLQWFYDQTIELISSLNLQDCFDTPGWVPDPRSYLREADIAVQTSHTEGLSLALLEQMMTGLAIVATDVGDTPAAIEDGVTGILIPTQDDESLTNALRSLICDAERSERLGAAARRRAIDEFSIEAMSRFAIEQYRRVLEAR